MQDDDKKLNELLIRAALEMAADFIDSDDSALMSKHMMAGAIRAIDPAEVLAKLSPQELGPTVVLTYTNWRGETSQRTITPMSLWYGATDWHPEPQWLLRGWDHSKGAHRDFALKDFGHPAEVLAKVRDGRQPIAAHALALKEIVEGISGAMDHGTWRDEHGMRLKDTPQWVQFYNALSTPPQEAPNERT